MHGFFFGKKRGKIQFIYSCMKITKRSSGEERYDWNSIRFFHNLLLYSQWIFHVKKGKTNKRKSRHISIRREIQVDVAKKKPFEKRPIQEKGSVFRKKRNHPKRNLHLQRALFAIEAIFCRFTSDVLFFSLEKLNENLAIIRFCDSFFSLWFGWETPIIQ